MRRHPREERSRLVFLKLRFGKSFCGSDRAKSETRHREWMSRHPERCQKIARQSIPRIHQRRKNAAVRRAVLAESFRGHVERTIDDQRSAVVKRMSECRRRINEFESMFLQRQLREEWRAGAERMDCGADVVNEARQGELCRSGSAANG